MTVEDLVKSQAEEIDIENNIEKQKDAQQQISSNLAEFSLTELKGKHGAYPIKRE
ncbi:MAG: hypothetical protein H8E54_04490 [Candidatus Aminicenantes bacterium]|nr:hypothetical protein [Candidatus Aminicenantes bacterium]